MKQRLLGVAVLAAFLGMLAFAPTVTRAHQESAPATAIAPIPITGSFTDRLGGDGTFAGTFTPTRFVLQQDQLFVVGKLAGTMTDSANKVLKDDISRVIRLPVGDLGGAGVSAAATCPILALNLGPLDLNLLGLQVHLNQVVLNINASSGPGQLLGNLLCSLVGILDQNNLTGVLTRLLNILLGLQ